MRGPSARVWLALPLLALLGWRVCRTESASDHPAAAPQVAPAPTVQSEQTPPSDRLDHARSAPCLESDAGSSPTSCAAPSPIDASDGLASMSEIERASIADPRRALSLIAVADQRSEPEDELRRALEIRALVSLQRIGMAHAKLQHFYERYPHSPQLSALARLTGYHPRPSSRYDSK